MTAEIKLVFLRESRRCRFEITGQRFAKFIAVAGRRRVPLAPALAMLLLVVLGRRVAFLDNFIEVLWPDPDKMPDAWMDTFRIQKTNLNNRLRPLGWRVINLGRQRYSLEHVGQQIIVPAREEIAHAA